MEKEEVLENWYNMIKKSWTYAKLTKEEKQRLDNVITSYQLEKTLLGNKDHKYTILQTIYYSFLVGLGYNSPTWREEEG